jgi:predicted DNA binding CopG/RHH family protein
LVKHLKKSGTAGIARTAGLSHYVATIPLNLLQLYFYYLEAKMASNRLNIRGLSDEQLTWLKQEANKYNVSISAYVLMVLEQHIEQKAKQQAELILSSPLNELIEANNRSVQTQNANTVAIGERLKEMTKNFISQLNRIENDRH